MLSRLRNRKLFAVAIIIAVIGLTTAWYASASFRGNLAARWDVAHGRYRVLAFGLPSRAVPEYSWLLRERYGIEYKPVAGCIVSPSIMSYVSGYDAVSTAAADLKFGHPVFIECMQDAEKNLRAAAENLPKTMSLSPGKEQLVMNVSVPLGGIQQCMPS